MGGSWLKGGRRIRMSSDVFKRVMDLATHEETVSWDCPVKEKMNALFCQKKKKSLGFHLIANEMN